MKHKPLLKTLMTFVAMTVCLGFAPKAFAQQSVPYTQNFENVESMHLPSGWSQGGVVYTTDSYDGYSGSKTLLLYCGNVTSTAILPTFNKNISTLTIDFWMRPVVAEGYSHTSADYVSVGYLTESDDYTEVNRYYWSENEIWQQRRAAFVNAPSNARIAIRAFCDSHTYWLIDDVHVYTTPSPVMDVPYQPMMMEYIPNGWVTNNYNYQPGIWTSVWPYFSTGYTAFPQLSVPLNQLRLIMGIKPHSNASSLKIGYMTNPYSLSTFTAVQEWTSWYTDGSFEDWQTLNVTYCFQNIPTNARIAIKCVGEWEFAENGPRVEQLAIFESYTPTSNWVPSSSLNFADDVIQGSGVVAFPSFDRSIATAALDMSLKPVAAGSTIQIGYTNNPNSPSSFVSIGTIAEYNSSWTDFQTVTEDNLSVFNTYPNARLALQFNGSWVIDEICLYEHFVLLPATSQALNTLYLDIELKPLGDDRSVQIGYVTNANNQTTFTALQTINSSYSWTDYHSYTICYVGVPANATRMALVYNGGGWDYQNVNVYDEPDPIGVPYNPTFGPDSPEGWIAVNYGYSLSSNDAYLSSGCAILPRFNVALGPLQMDIDLKPASSNKTIQIGYLTNPSDPSTFTALQTFVSSDFYYSSNSFSCKTKRVSLYGAPANARIALVCDGSWYIRNLSVYYMPTPIGAPYTPELPTTGQPDGWIANNYNYSSSGNSAYLSSGCAILPRFNSITAPLSTLQMDIDLKPASSNKTIQIGYLTNPNDLSTFVVLQTFVSSDFYYSSNSFCCKTKRISFQGAPGDARITLVCDGSWSIQNVSVNASTPVGVPYTPELPTTGLPEGWIANNYDYSTYNDVAYLSSGCAILPRFNVPLGTLLMDIDLKPTNGSSDKTIQIGYLTNPNDLSSFTVLQTYSGFSSWSEFRAKRISFQGAPDDARIALVCVGTWYIQNVNVYALPPIGVPYTPELPTTGQPEGWIANNYGYNTTNSYVYLNSGRAVLPRFNVPLGTLLMDIDLNPQYSNKTIQIGYITNPNDPSTFTVLQTFNSNSSWCGKYRTKRISFQGAPDDARIAIVCEGTWEIRNVEVCVSTYETPYAEGFEDTEAGSMPLPWMSGTSNVAVTNSNPHSGSQSLYVPSGDANIVLPRLTFHSGSPRLEFRLCPNGTHASGDYISIGYATNPNDMSTFVEFARYNWNENWGSDYRNLYCSGMSLYYMVIRTHSSSGSWYIDDVYAYDPFTVPYTEDFGEHQGWATYTGHLAWHDDGAFFTSQRTPTNQGWQYGTANGVFGDSDHAYVTIGGNANQNYWLVSPYIRCSNYDMLSFNLAMSRSTGNMVPLYPDAQDHQTVYALVTTDGGYTWHSLQGWRHEMGYADLEALTPQGHVYNFNLSPYQGEDIQLAFYAECTHANDNLNRVHLDDINIVSFDPSQPPTSVTFSEVAGHSVKVSWTAASPAQHEWDVIVASPYFDPSTMMEQLEDYGGVMEHVIGYLYKTMTGLEANDRYKAWVRYNDGTTTSAWVTHSNPSYFDTENMCAIPTNIQVETTLHTAYISWDPGQSNQTSWYTYCDIDDMEGDTVTEPFRLIGGLDPGTEYDFQVTGYCEDGDGESERVDITFTTQPLPTLTVNNGTNYNEYVVVVSDQCQANNSWSQFVIPAEQLTDMQYSTITELKFYIETIAQSWAGADFVVKMKEVPFSHLGSYCDDSFYDWDDMTQYYGGSLNVSNNTVTIHPDWNASFHYTGGNLLIGVKQVQASNAECHVAWYGTETGNVSSSMYKGWLDSEQSICNEFLPKVTFTYETDDYLPPTDIVVEPIGNYEVYVSWTMRDGSTAVDFEISDDNFTNDVWGYEDIEDGYFIYDDVWPEDNFQVRLRSVFVVDGETIRSAWSQPVSFTMPEICESPYNLEADNIGPFSATLAWEGDAVEYEVEYREVLSEGFENGVPEGWTSLKGTETSNGWYRTGRGHSGDYSLVSICHSTNHGDDWLISPQVELGGRLSFWKTCAGPNTNFSIYVSTTGTDIDDFELVETGTASSSWGWFVKSLSSYSGLGYIAIRHNDNLSTARTLYIDDLLYSYPSWTTLDATTENSIEVSDLTPGKSYHFQVRGTCDTGFTSDWSSAFVFTTESNIVFEDPIVKAACVYAWDANGNGDGELSYAEAAAITDLGTVFQDQGQMHYFNELQYFTGLTEIGEDAFSGCSNLEAITLPSQITNIDYYAFGYCSSLQNITIPNGVTTIGDFAFIESGLTEVNLPPSVTYIGGLAFGDCNSLTSINIPASVTNINGNAFTGASIESIVVAVDNPTYDSRGGCNAIIKTASNKLITGCQNTVIPDDVTTIGISAFENATGLTEITLPASLTNIGEYAFLNCYGLTTINAAGETPPAIESNTFAHLNLDDITVNVPCGFLAAYKTDTYWSNFTHFVDPCNIVFADANVKAVCVANWDTNGDGELSYAEAEAVTSLGTVFRNNTTITSFNELVYFTGLQALTSHAFDGCSQLTSIMFPNSIIVLANYAFKGCSRLASVTLPDQLISIMNYAFQNCTALTQIDIPSTVTQIGEYSYNNCYSLQSIVVASGNSVYDSRNGCNAIIKTATNELVIGCDNTVIPDDVVTIGQNAFYGRTQMTTITLPASVTSIGAQAFFNCSGLQSIDVRSATPATLGSLAFLSVPTDIPVYVPCESIETYQETAGWSNFTNYQSAPEFICFADPNVKAVCVAHWDTNGDGELSYSEAAAVDLLSQHFQGNTSITTFDELQYFTGMVDISPNAFNGCTALVSVTLPESIQSIYASAFEGCTALQSIVIPDATTLVFIRAFYGCTSLSSIEFGTGLTTIRELAFRGCTGLTSLTLPASLATIGNAAFEYCTNLAEMTVLAVTPPSLDEYAFDYVPTTIPVYVPCESRAAYRAAFGWSDFTNIIDPCAGVVQTIELSAGTNWFSTNVEITLDDLKAALVATGYAPITIQSKNDGLTTYNGTRWRGSLSTLDVAQMYMVTVETACEIELEGAPVNPAEHPVIIHNGANWIAFPLSESMTITNAFAGFNVVSGDVVNSKSNGLATYTNRWRGTLTTLVPGQGYIYNSAATGDRVLIFPTSAK